MADNVAPHAPTSRDDVENAGGQARLGANLRKQQGRKTRVGRGF